MRPEPYVETEVGGYWHRHLEKTWMGVVCALLPVSATVLVRLGQARSIQNRLSACSCVIHYWTSQVLNEIIEA